MKHLIYLRSGKLVEVEADSVKCVDQKSRTYKFFKKADEDALQERYGFDDKHIMEAHIRKIIVPRGEEYIEFEILPLNKPIEPQQSATAADYFTKQK